MGHSPAGNIVNSDLMRAINPAIAGTASMGHGSHTPGSPPAPRDLGTKTHRRDRRLAQDAAAGPGGDIVMKKTVGSTVMAAWWFPANFRR